LIFYTQRSIEIFFIIIGIWAFIIGVVQLWMMSKISADVQVRNTLLINGIITLVFGVLLLIFPFTSAKVLVTISGLTIGVEDGMGVTRYYAAVEKKVPEVKQTSRVKITIDGEDLLNELETELKLLKRADVDLSKELNRLIITSEAMDEELAGLLEKARALMRERTGRIEILHEHADENLAQAFVQMRRSQALSRLPRIGRTFVGSSGPYVIDSFAPGRYAYAEKDRQRAAELESQSRDLARQYRGTDDEAGRTEAASKLKANLNALFDLKLQGYQEKMSAIESELERLRQRVEERKKNKELIVTGRFKELVGEDNHLRW